MIVTYKLLSTGYHYVRAVGYAHLFAQWPVGTLCDHSAVSSGEFVLSPETISNFIKAAQSAADKEKAK